jgi:serine/threonine protein phosphatase PrpC
MSYKFSKPEKAATNSGIRIDNQDIGFTDDNILGVFDGHGYKGELYAKSAAAACKEEQLSDFKTMFSSAEEKCRTDFRSFLTSSLIPFNEYNGVFYDKRNFPYTNPAFQGGTTATVIKLDKKTGKLSCANVGDSDAMIFDDMESEGTLITADHSPTCLDEWKRLNVAFPGLHCVFANGSKRTARSVWTKISADNWEINDLGGYNYADVRSNWASYIYVPLVGILAMTRVIGNFGFKRFGIIPEPDIYEVEPPAPGVTRAVVLGSDGLWDALHYKEIRDLVRNPEFLNKPEEATAALLKLGIDKSKERFASPACHDNITAIVAYYSI